MHPSRHRRPEAGLAYHRAELRTALCAAYKAKSWARRAVGEHWVLLRRAEG